MLSTIRNMIAQKTDFLEAASVIFEDGSGNNLDDIIVLGEENEVNEEELNLEDGKDDDNDEGDKNDDVKEDDKKNEDDDISNIPIEDEPVAEPEEPTPVAPEPDNSILDADISDEADVSLPGDDLPEPIGRQTGEPISDTNDFLNVEIDLGSNTQKDVLPVPPSNAGDVIAGDNDTQHVDSGFENEDVENTPAEPELVPEGESTPSSMADIIESFFPNTNKIWEDSYNQASITQYKKLLADEQQKLKNLKSTNKNNNNDVAIKVCENQIEWMKDQIKSFGGTVESVDVNPDFMEAITIGDEAPSEEKPAEDTADTSSAPPAEEPPEGEESEVTSAVRDKVSEAEAEPDAAAAPSGNKEDLLKKLGNITKSLEDAKKAIMNSIQ